MVGKFCLIFPMIGKIFRPFSNDWEKFCSSWFSGSSGIIVDGEDGREREEIFGAWRVREHSPPSERGVPPGGRWLVDCECGADGKGGGGSTAGGRGCRLSHAPSAEELILLLRCEVVIAATADRSTPPVAAPAACLLPCIRLPFMAAPPPSRRGASGNLGRVPAARGRMLTGARRRRGGRGRGIGRRRRSSRSGRPWRARASWSCGWGGRTRWRRPTRWCRGRPARSRRRI